MDWYSWEASRSFTRGLRCGRAPHGKWNYERGPAPRRTVPVSRADRMQQTLQIIRQLATHAIDVGSRPLLPFALSLVTDKNSVLSCRSTKGRLPGAIHVLTIPGALHRLLKKRTTDRKGLHRPWHDNDHESRTCEWDDMKVGVGPHFVRHSAARPAPDVTDRFGISTPLRCGVYLLDYDVLILG